MPEYKAIAYFGDSSDRGHSYGVGDTYPRKKFNPTTERVAFLLSGGYIAEESEEMEVELKAILKEKGLDVPARANKSELIKLIAEA